MVDVPVSFTSFERRFAGLPAAVLKNRFFEESPAMAKGSAMLARPGTEDVASFGTGPLRSFYSLPGLFGGALFAVSGDALYRYNADGTTIPIAGKVFGTGNVSMTGVAGAGYERLFLADGTLLQLYQGGSHASGVLTATSQVSDGDSIRIGSTHYRWVDTVVNGSGTLADPFRVKIGPTLADSLGNMVKAIGFSGISGVDYSANIGGQNSEVTAVSDATTLTVTARSDLTDGNLLVTAITAGGAGFGTRFVAVASSGTGDRVMTSDNGILWTIRTSAADSGWQTVVWAAQLGLFVTVANAGAGNRVMTSPDGITWTGRAESVANNWQSVAWSPQLGLFAAVASTGTGNRVMTSPDGITWTTRATPADNGWISVAWAPELGLFCAVAFSGAGNRVMTSPDGINWTVRISAADNSWASVAWSPQLGLFAAVASTGTGNRVMTSPDGINWTMRTSAADNNWNEVEWSAELGLFIAVAGLPGAGNRVMTSPDGIAWSIRTSAADNNWMSVVSAHDGGLTWGAATLTGGGVHALSGVAVPDGQPPVSVATLKSYIIVAIGSTDRFYWVNPGNVTIDALSFATAESQPDDVIDATVTGDNVWFVGEGTTEVWYATGDSAAPFAPVGGRVYDRGAIDGTMVNVKGVVFLVGQDHVVYAIGGGAERVSNHGVEEMIRLALGA